MRADSARGVEWRRVTMRAEFDRLRVVLVATRNPLNIGAAARAMSNFGFLRLRVVNPYEVAFREGRPAVGAGGAAAAGAAARGRRTGDPQTAGNEPRGAFIRLGEEGAFERRPEPLPLADA